jgi:uncharacterized GH25 family protein
MRIYIKAGSIISTFFISIFAPAAIAHYLWIEQNATGNARLNFGEFENALKEKSPGRLDDIKAPSVTISTTKTVTATRTANGFTLNARADSKNSLTAIDNSMGVKDWRSSGVGMVKPIFYARYVASSAAMAAQMAFDVTPSGRPGQFIVTLNGKPLAKTKVDMFAPNGWARDARTDEAGMVTFPMPWRGQYVIEVTHKEDIPGEFEGAKYEALRHRATLTIQQTRGEKTFAPTKASMTMP